MSGSYLSQLGLSGQAASLQVQYPNLPAGLLEAQAAKEGGVNLATGAAITNSSGHTGLAQTSASTAADPGYGVTPLANSQDASSSLNFMAAYDSALITRYGSADAGLSHYSGNAYTATSLGVGNSTGSSLADPFAGASTPNPYGTGNQVTFQEDGAGGGISTSSTGAQTTTDALGNITGTAQLTPAQTAANNASSAGSSGTGLFSGLSAAFGEYFVRAAVLVLGLIFVGAGLMMFKNPVGDAIKGVASKVPVPV